MPRAAFKEKNYAPTFNTEITHNQIKFQTLLARQNRISESLHIENSITAANSNNSSLSKKNRSDSAALTFTLTDGRSLLVGGFISQLITWVLDRSSDWNEYDSILYHFRYFLSPNDFLRAIIQWYEDSSDSLAPQAKLLRVESVLGRWLHLCPSDFITSESLCTDFLNFLNFVKMIDSSIYNNIQLIYLDMTKPKINKSKQPILIVHNQLDVLSFAPMDIAKQLSLDHFDLFYEITWSDLIDSKARQQSGRIDVLVKHFNNISLLVATEIVTTPNIKKRMAIIKHMISLAQACFELRNFSMLLAITVGLNMGPIQRLKKVWKLVPRASMNALNTLEDLMSPFGNYSKYRTALQNSSYPCLPYFGLYLRDLTYIEDGNADLLENGHCNMEKMRMKTAILKDVRYHQRRRYDFPPASKIESYLYSMKVLDPAAIQKISSTIEENVL